MSRMDSLVFSFRQSHESDSAQQYQYDTVPSQKHLTDEAILVDTFRTSLAFLSPHFFDIFEDHVAVAIKSLNARQ